MISNGITPDGVLNSPAATATKMGKYALGALFLFAIASIIAGWSGNRLATIILTAVVVLGFAIAILGFERLARAKGGYYARLAMVLTTLTLTAVTVLFLAVLSYIGVGRPVALDRFFGRQPAVAPAASIRIVDRNSVALNLVPYVDEEAQIEATLFISGRDQPIGTPNLVSAKADRLRLAGLQPGTRYRIRLVAVAEYRRSLPFDLFVATDAANLNLAAYSGFSRHYTGKLTLDGIPDDDNGEMTFSQYQRPNEQEPKQWNYRGRVRNGLPDGRGTIETDPTECDSVVCGSRCELEFSAGVPVQGHCELRLPSVQVRKLSDAGRAILYSRPSQYTGSVGNAERNASAQLGPFGVWFSGAGKLVAHDRDYTDIYEGTWTQGSFDKGNVDGDNGGHLEGGQEYVQSRCLLVLTPLKGKAIGGNGGRITCNGLELGEWRGSDQFYGFDSSVADNVLWSWWYSRGQKKALKVKNWKPYIECLPEETWGLPDVTGEPNNPDWKLTCDRSNGPFECSLASSAVDVELIGRKPLNSIPQVQFRTSGNVRGGDTSILIDGAARTLRSFNKQQIARNMATAAELCSASTLKNMEQGQEVSLKGFCPKLALMFNRLLTCSGPLGNLGDQIKEPNPVEFNPKDFIQPSFSENGQTIRFSATRLNEGFYIIPEFIGNMSATISAGDVCEKSYHIDFPLAFGVHGEGIQKSLFTDEWRPVVLSYFLKTTKDYIKGYYDLMAGPEFARDPYKCYKVDLLVEYFFKFTFNYYGRGGAVIYRLLFPIGEYPKSSDLSTAGMEQFIRAKIAYDMLPKDAKDAPGGQQIAIAFDRMGLPTKWRQLRW